MIYQLSGKLIEKNESDIVIDIQGIGYQVFAPSTVIHSLPSLNESTTIYTFHYIREDQQVLFGFSSKEERELFIKLTSVSGIGPKVGIKILSTMTSSVLIQAIATGNVTQLTQTPGVGKKVAERLIIELKDKLPSVYTDMDQSENTISVQTQENPLKKDLTLALKTLGYHQDEIKRALAKSKDMLTDQHSLEDGIRILLKQL